MKLIPPNITPGPWYTFADCGPVIEALHESKETRVCRVADGWADPEAEANARAIAATPDTLAALALLVQSYQPPVRGAFKGCVSPEMQQARAALLKAGYKIEE